MKAAKLTNGIVTNLWEVSSLTCYEGVTLIEAPDFVGMGATYDGTTFVNLPPLPPTQVEINAKAQAYLASTDWMVLRQADSGEVMPNNIKDARAAARLEIK